MEKGSPLGSLSGRVDDFGHFFDSAIRIAGVQHRIESDADEAAADFGSIVVYDKALNGAAIENILDVLGIKVRPEVTRSKENSRKAKFFSDAGFNFCHFITP